MSPKMYPVLHASNLKIAHTFVACLDAIRKTVVKDTDTQIAHTIILTMAVGLTRL